MFMTIYIRTRGRWLVIILHIYVRNGSLAAMLHNPFLRTMELGSVTINCQLVRYMHNTSTSHLHIYLRSAGLVTVLHNHFVITVNLHVCSVTVNHPLGAQIKKCLHLLLVDRCSTGSPGLGHTKITMWVWGRPCKNQVGQQNTATWLPGIWLTLHTMHPHLC